MPESSSTCGGLPVPPFRRKTRRRTDGFVRTVAIVGGVCLAYVAVASFGSNTLDQHDAPVRSRRLLQETTDEPDPTASAANECSEKTSDSEKDKNSTSLFPPDLFTEAQLKHGGVILYIIGIIYMFYALALVCDEFFVPSLDVITEKLGVTADVAGATFMAAGGSAPELFTSIIGVFISQDDVGIGTIVGSAVFNILFVIAACAFAAKEALKLTAWPLIRDVFFYSVSLVLLVVFFLDEKIRWYEALALFLWYFAYVGFMKFNERVEDELRKLFDLPEVNRDSRVKGVILRAAVHRKGLFHLMNETINPGVLHSKRSNNTSPEDGKELEPLNPTSPKGREERNPDDKEAMMMGGVAAQPAGGVTGIGKLKNALAGSAATDVSVAPSTGNGADMEMGPKTASSPEPDGSKQHNNEVNPGSKSSMSPDEPKADDDEDEEEQPIDMAFPKGSGWKAIVVYLISLPIMLPLYYTLPDTKNDKRKKFFVVTFVGSILWIAVFSYLMVWWAGVTGETIGIPPAVMGLTFLAAGTSVPDLITSVLVAQKGKGDMAVSSSVGSNIFDVCVGLPLPWLLYTAAFQNDVSVSSKGIGCSIGLLFLMLVLVFVSILAFRWQMTKGMGVMMMVLYFIFVIVTLGFTELTGPWYGCPFDAKCA